MQPLKLLKITLQKIANDKRYLFSSKDLRSVLPEISDSAYRAVLNRAERDGVLKRACHGIYICTLYTYAKGFELYHIAAKLRASEFNYISLESALSDYGVISQIPLQWLTIMSSGRTHVVNCGSFGKIEFIHTKRKASALSAELIYDQRTRLWRASVSLALADMKFTQRNCELLDMEIVDELI